MHVDVAASALLFDVRHFAARGQLTIPTHDASAGQCPKPKEPYETHCSVPRWELLQFMCRAARLTHANRRVVIQRDIREDRTVSATTRRE
jgi:hypothetical protein